MPFDCNENFGAIIWDADGVLINSYDENGTFHWSRKIKRDIGVPDEVVAAIFKTQDIHGTKGWSDVLLGRKETKAHIQEIFSLHGIQVSVDAYIDYWLSKDVAVNEFAARYLNPETAYIGTNQDPLRTKRLERLFQGRVRKVFSSSSLGIAKPDTKYFFHIEKSLSLPPHRLVFVDDAFENVAEARKRGWTAHHYTSPELLSDFMKPFED